MATMPETNAESARPTSGAGTEYAVRSTQYAAPGPPCSALGTQYSVLNPPSEADVAASMVGWKYRRWIEALQTAGGHFVTAADILDGRISRSACNLLLRHDIDQCELYANVWPLLAIEHRFGIRSTTYLFAEQDRRNWTCRRRGFPTFRKEWTLNLSAQVLRYQDEGFEFGLHVDAVGRCRRQGNTVSADEALAVVGRDVARLRSQGIRVRTMAAHGFAWPDRMRPWYDNYAAEFDFTAGDRSVQSQFHVLERFAELGRPVSSCLGLDRMKKMRSIWLPRHVPFGWLHARTESTHLRADALSLTDAAGAWKYLGIRELTTLLPQLPGCLVVLNVHPIYYAYGDDGLESTAKAAQLDDHGPLGDLLAGQQRVAQPGAAVLHDLWKIRYRGAMDFDRIGPAWVTDRLHGECLERLDRELRRINARFQGGSWFEHLVNSPNTQIIAWLDEVIEPRDRQRLRLLELCGGVGPVAVGLVLHGFRPENMAVSDFDPKHVAIAAAYSKAVAGGKIRTFPLDVRDLRCPETFDLVVISSWENSILPYDRVTSECRKVVAEGGLLVMTFLEKSRIDSEGYDHFPDRLLQQKTYSTIAAEELMRIFEANGFEPVCYLDHGYPNARFPRHVLVGRKRAGMGHSRPRLCRAVRTAEGGCATGDRHDGTFAALEAASQRYFNDLHRILSDKQQDLPPWPMLLNVGPLAGDKQIEGLKPDRRVRLLSLGVRKATCHPFGPWNLDYSRTGFDRPAVLAGLLVGYGNKCGAVAELTRCLLAAHGVQCRTIACAGRMPGGEPVAHCLNEVFLDGIWRLLDNDVFQLSDTFMTAGDGLLMTREEALALGVQELVRRYPWPYTYQGFEYDPDWVERNWSAWHHAVGGTVRILA